MIVLLELIQNNRFVWGHRCYVIIGLLEQLLSLTKVLLRCMAQESTAFQISGGGKY